MRDEDTPRFTESTKGQVGAFKVEAWWNDLVEIELLITNGAAEYRTNINGYEADVLIKVLQHAIARAMTLEENERL